MILAYLLGKCRNWKGSTCNFKDNIYVIIIIFKYKLILRGSVAKSATSRPRAVVCPRLNQNISLLYTACISSFIGYRLSPVKTTLLWICHWETAVKRCKSLWENLFGFHLIHTSDHFLLWSQPSFKSPLNAAWLTSSNCAAGVHSQAGFQAWVRHAFAGFPIHFYLHKKKKNDVVCQSIKFKDFKWRWMMSTVGPRMVNTAVPVH